MVRDLKLQDGQFVGLHLEPIQDVPLMSPEFLDVMDRLWEDHEDEILMHFDDEDALRKQSERDPTTGSE